MKEYLEKALHQNIVEKEYNDLAKLPLICRKAFKLKLLRIGELEFLIAEPLEELNLSEIRKRWIQFERLSGYPCAFLLKKVNWYSQSKMVEEGIPFVWVEHQVYLPFLGMLLTQQNIRTLKPCFVLSFLTQKLLLKALYENWHNVSAAQASKLLNVSRMSVTRCFDEIESIGLPFLKTAKKSRRFFSLEDKKLMWETMLPFLRNPVIKTFRLESEPKNELILGGTTALSRYSLLEDDKYPTFLAKKDEVGVLGIKSMKEVPANEEPACVVQEVGYVIPFGDGKAIDPLSLSLTLDTNDLSDPRVEICRNQMLEELFDNL